MGALGSDGLPSAPSHSRSGLLRAVPDKTEKLSLGLLILLLEPHRP